MNPEEMSRTAQRAASRAGRGFNDIVAAVESLEDPWDRALVSGWVLNELMRLNEGLRAVRNDTVRELNDAGFSYRELSSHLGLSTGRIQQMRNDSSGPRRRGKIEIAVEQKKGTLSPRASAQSRMDAVFPVILSFRHGERLPAKRVAEMLDLPAGTVTKPWKQAVQDFLETKNA